VSPAIIAEGAKVSTTTKKDRPMNVNGYSSILHDGQQNNIRLSDI